MLLKIVLLPSLERGGILSARQRMNRPSSEHSASDPACSQWEQFPQRCLLLKPIFMMRMPRSRLREFRRDDGISGGRIPHNLSSVLSEQLFKKPVYLHNYPLLTSRHDDQKGDSFRVVPEFWPGGFRTVCSEAAKKPVRFLRRSAASILNRRSCWVPAKPQVPG